jgi:ribose transport system ATP-binding protein
MIYVSHRLREILAIADVVTAMRDGRCAFHGPARGLSEADLVQRMVGDSRIGRGPRGALAGGDRSKIIMRVEGMKSGALEAANLVLHAGEIVGCVGLRGAGQEAIGRALAGIASFSGAVHFKDRLYRPRNVADAFRHGVAFISGNREVNSVRTMSVVENLFINPRFTPLPRWFRSTRAERAATERVKKSYDVRLHAPTQPMGELSGGNAQKIVLARGLESSPVLVILEDPTAGVDMPTRYALYDFMLAHAANGVAFLITSSDHDEVAAICDCIHVFRGGRIATTLDSPPFDPEKIATLASQKSHD